MSKDQEVLFGKQMKKILSCSLALWILLTLLLSHRSELNAAIPEGQPSPYEKVTYHLDTSNFPPGLKVFSPKDPPIEGLTNEGSEPFYLVEKVGAVVTSYPNSELPPNYRPIYKLQNSQVYLYSASGYWPLSISHYGELAKMVAINSMPCEIGESSQVEGKAISGPQKLTCLGFYRGQEIAINGEVVYTLKAGEESVSSPSVAETSPSVAESPPGLWQPSVFVTPVGVALLLGFIFAFYLIKTKT